MDCVVRGRTLLCLAAARGYDYCNNLLEKGLDPNMKCDNESRPRCRFGCALSSAAFVGNLDTMKALVGKRADVNPENLEDDYGSPLATAVHFRNFDCARFLLEKGADANAQLRCGDFGSPLIAAVCGRKIDCVHLILEHKADVNAKSEFGQYGSPLAAAASTGQVDCARFLIEHGADVNAHLKFGVYGSILAAAILGTFPSLDMIEFLVEEAKADLAQLAFVPPREMTARQKRDRSIERRSETDTIYVFRRRVVELAAYLMQEHQIEVQVLISLGVPPGLLPPVTGTMADNEYEELDEYDMDSEHDRYSGESWASESFWR